jgi:hypothetical protein
MVEENELSAEQEAAHAKKTLGIGLPLEERIAKLRTNGFQYCSAGTARVLVETLEKYRTTLEQVATYEDGGRNIGISRTCVTLNKIAKEALK